MPPLEAADRLANFFERMGDRSLKNWIGLQQFVDIQHAKEQGLLGDGRLGGGAPTHRGGGSRAGINKRKQERKMGQALKRFQKSQAQGQKRAESFAMQQDFAKRLAGNQAPLDLSLSEDQQESVAAQANQFLDFMAY